MDRILIRGGRRLEGEVEVSGAKNAVLPLLAATLLTSGKSVLRGVPRLRDVNTMLRLLGHMGATWRWPEAGAAPGAEGESAADALAVDTSRITQPEAPYDLVKTMRASILVLGPLVARYGRARVSLPGGCAIGARPINLHLKGLEALGAKIELSRGYVSAQADRLIGGKIYFDTVTVTGTENMMMAASLAEGITAIENAAQEPEVVELARVLNLMGAKVHGAGTPTIVVEGVPILLPVEVKTMPDRIEAGTFMVAAAITGGDVRIRNARPEHLDAISAKLVEAGAQVEASGGGLRVVGPERPRGVDVRTQPFPGFATDMQAQFMSLMALASGQCRISETVFENRFMHVSELQRMGADISIAGWMALVRGVPRLSGAPVMATDLRASACLVLAGLAAEGETEISRVYHLDRGYERIEEKLSRLGADIERKKDS
jgi:UDP-N-acetylglucosamine 1-carboxyvinyltransferase